MRPGSWETFLFQMNLVVSLVVSCSADPDVSAPERLAVKPAYEVKFACGYELTISHWFIRRCLRCDMNPIMYWVGPGKSGDKIWR